MDILELVGKAYISYNKIMPNHRGKYRFARVLDDIFKSFYVRTPQGFLMEIFLSSSMDLSYYDSDNNSSHSRVIEIINTMDDGDIFIDIGANIGFYSILASKRVGDSGRVICFEPSHREFRRLLKNIELNELTNIIPFNSAVSDRAGEARLDVAESHTGLNKLSNNSINKNGILVPVMTGDIISQYFDIDLCNKNNTKVVIKIDVEGAEYFVIKGIEELLTSLKSVTVIAEITDSFLKNFGHDKFLIYSLMQSAQFTPSIQSEEWQYDEVFCKK